MEFDQISIRGATYDQLEDPEVMKKFHEKNDYFIGKRAHVIERALNVEHFLKVALLHFFVGDDYPRHKLLKIFVFEPESFSFMGFRKMLSRIFETFGDRITCFDPKEGKELRRRIQKVIDVRNMFAHGEIFIYGPSGEAIVSYYSSKVIEQKLSDELLEEFDSDCDYIDEKLEILNEFFRENSLDLGNYGDGPA